MRPGSAEHWHTGAFADSEQQARLVGPEGVQQAPQHRTDARPQQLASHGLMIRAMSMKDIVVISTSERPLWIRRIMACSVELASGSIFVPSRRLVKADFYPALARDGSLRSRLLT